MDAEIYWLQIQIEGKERFWARLPRREERLLASSRLLSFIMYQAVLTQRISLKLDIGELHEHLLRKWKLVEVRRKYRTLREDITTSYCCRGHKLCTRALMKNTFFYSWHGTKIWKWENSTPEECKIGVCM
jgi:hypothetical protein